MDRGNELLPQPGGQPTLHPTQQYEPCPGPMT
jgi:hypothetical protein